MTVSYAWTFGKFTVAPSLSGLTNVVTEIPYTLSATDGVSTKAVSGNIALGQADVKNFIAFGSLTQQNAIDWCSAGLDVPGLQANLAAALAAPAPPAATVTMKPGFEP